jgi:hypothetical protein
MKNIKQLFLSIISFALLSGCLQVDTTVYINKDGSGTIEETVLMSNAVVDMMNEFMSSFQDSAKAPEEFNLYKEEELKEKATGYGEGVEYVSGEEIKTDGWQGYKAIYSFEDLNTITMETDPNAKVELDKNEEGKKNEYFSFKFIRGDVSELIIDRPELKPNITTDKQGSEEENVDVAIDDSFLKLMEGMKVQISLSFDGDIVETNATYVKGSIVNLLDIDFGKLFKNKESLEMLKNNPPDNLEEMKVIVENVPGMKIELQRPVFIKFE